MKLRLQTFKVWQGRENWSSQQSVDLVHLDRWCCSVGRCFVIVLDSFC